jgi:hypothetical protein
MTKQRASAPLPYLSTAIARWLLVCFSLTSLANQVSRNLATDGSKLAATELVQPGLDRDSGVRTAVSLHDDVLPAQRTAVLPLSLHDNEASYAEQMAAP